jgi:CRP/FNR family cyclic AMP-dependent transcriptional regulator
MTLISVNSGTASNRFDAIFAAVIASCADFCAGARQGRDIEGRYHELARRSDTDLDRLGLTRSDIAQVFLPAPYCPSLAPPGRALFCAIGHGDLSCGRRAGPIPPFATPMAAAAPANLFSVFPESLAAKLFANAKPVKLAADEVLFLAGDPGDGCYRVDQGLLKISMIAPSGAERILAIVGRGGIVGELSTIDGLPRSASVAAVRESELTFVSRATFQAFAEENPQVYMHLVTLLAARLRDTDGVVAAGSFLPLKGRVARALLDLAEAFGQDVGKGRILIRQKVSQSDVAAMAGIARENVSRILNDWIRDKLVSRLSGYYCLENKTRLERESAI